ncbi:MAG: methyl-accepting chemotaxis protein [Calditrichota bacterium]
MSRWLRMGLTDKLFIPFVGILLLTVILTAVIILWMGKRDDDVRMEQNLQRMELQWKTVTETLWGQGQLDLLKSIYRRAAETDPVLNHLALINLQGQIIASSSGDGIKSTGGLRRESTARGPNGQSGRFILEYAQAINHRSAFALFFTIFLTGLSAIVLGSFIYMRVLKSVLLIRIRSAVTAASAIADRDLTRRLEVYGEDELTALAQAFNIMTDNLTELTRTIHKAVSEMDEKTAGILSAVEFQAERSTRQSTQVSQISVTMSNMAELMQHISQTSSDMVKIAAETRQDADRGAKTTDDSRSRMDAIAGSSRERIQQIRDLRKRANQVGEVMELIEQIADQTKLIAFNASIEAAGAGEMGRRFEVVAREIRRLAENAADSANQIHSRITDIQQAAEILAATTEEESQIVKAGSDAALHTVTALHSIREGTARTASLFENISETIQQQNTAAGGLAKNLTEINREAGSLKEGLSDLTGIAQAMKKLSGDLRVVSGSFRMNIETAPRKADG